MPILIRIKQDKSEGTTRSGKWYGRPVHTDTLDINDVAALVQENCSIKASDVKAVIEEMVSVIQRAVLDSKKVTLDRLGTFYCSAHSVGAETLDDFDIAKHMRRPSVRFQEPLHYEASTELTKKGNPKRICIRGITKGYSYKEV